MRITSTILIIASIASAVCAAPINDNVVARGNEVVRADWRREAQDWRRVAADWRRDAEAQNSV